MVRAPTSIWRVRLCECIPYTFERWFKRVKNIRALWFCFYLIFTVCFLDLHILLSSHFFALRFYLCQIGAFECVRSSSIINSSIVTPHLVWFKNEKTRNYFFCCCCLLPALLLHTIKYKFVTFYVLCVISYIFKCAPQALDCQRKLFIS